MCEDDDKPPTMSTHSCLDRSLVRLVVGEREEVSDETEARECRRDSLVAFFDIGFLLGSSSRLIRPSSSLVSSHRSTGNLRSSILDSHCMTVRRDHEHVGIFVHFDFDVVQKPSCTEARSVMVNRDCFQLAESNKHATDSPEG